MAVGKVLTVHICVDPQILWRQFLKFKETELPAKEADKNRSKHVFNSFEVSLSLPHFGCYFPLPLLFLDSPSPKVFRVTFLK